ncbi:hypothetical protein FTUN_0086 [Frigoriglobus tundricola]|uniref:Uncharacterized protein n=1 Tax=Frigoriglobus tundricola TaxID=2774151 RepID=A0A6M5YF17_9BACT|nr:hypothetical protein FTUN_0086 [Frigoriglobus tundricola]
MTGASSSPNDALIKYKRTWRSPDPVYVSTRAYQAEGK